MITGAEISSDDRTIIVQLNRTVLADPLTDEAVDFTISMYGPRETQWYPVGFSWTNELSVKSVAGRDYFTFTTDFTDPMM